VRHCQDVHLHLAAGEMRFSLTGWLIAVIAASWLALTVPALAGGPTCGDIMGEEYCGRHGGWPYGDFIAELFANAVMYLGPFVALPLLVLGVAVPLVGLAIGLYRREWRAWKDTLKALAMMAFCILVLVMWTTGEPKHFIRTAGIDLILVGVGAIWMALHYVSRPPPTGLDQGRQDAGP